MVLTASLFRGAFSAKVINKYNIRFREDIRKSEDTLFYARFLTHIDKVVLSDIVPYNYRIRPDSLTTTYRQPSILGIEKGLSIISDFNHWAEQCEGLGKNKITNYFNYRYVGIVINYVLGLTDFRSKLSISEIRDRINELYSYRELAQKIDKINSFSEYSITQRVKILLVKRRVGLIAYGKVFHLLKWIKYKIR